MGTVVHQIHVTGDGVEAVAHVVDPRDLGIDFDHRHGFIYPYDKPGITEQDEAQRFADQKADELQKQLEGEPVAGTIYRVERLRDFMRAMHPEQ